MSGKGLPDSSAFFPSSMEKIGESRSEFRLSFASENDGDRNGLLIHHYCTEHTLADAICTVKRKITVYSKRFMTQNKWVTVTAIINKIWASYKSVNEIANSTETAKRRETKKDTTNINDNNIFSLAVCATPNVNTEYDRTHAVYRHSVDGRRLDRCRTVGTCMHSASTPISICLRLRESRKRFEVAPIRTLCIICMTHSHAPPFAFTRWAMQKRSARLLNCKCTGYGGAIGNRLFVFVHFCRCSKRIPNHIFYFACEILLFHLFHYTNA